uniref:Uncharacterized protein n=1 Tax=Rhizophora mucronata TaxID=61149 RepID=A0A2P2Q6F8_RHIMU
MIGPMEAHCSHQHLGRRNKFSKAMNKI